MQRRGHWFVLLLAALVLLVSGSALGGQRYFCRMAGRVVADCCCEGVRAPEGVARTRTVTPADCCERIQADSGAQLGRAVGASESFPSAALASIVAEPSYELPGFRVLPAFAQPSRGPPPRPQLFVLHCALLI